MSFNLNLGNWNAVFVVPSSVVDKHIKLAGSAQLKVLLWILRHAGENFSIDDISNALSMQPVDIKDAMQYWIETNIISYNNNEIVPANINNNQDKNSKPEISNDNKSEPEKDVMKKEKTRLLSRPQKPDSIFVAKRIKDSPDIAFMMQEAQVILGRPLSNSDTATLLMLHDNDGLPVDVIIMIIQYAVSIGKTHMKYIEKTAINWSCEEIDTLEKAERKIRSLTQSKEAWNIVLKTIGIEHRSPTTKEQEFANHWINEMKFTPDMIQEAYERCVNSKGKYIASYMDGILSRWFNSGIKTLEQANQERQNIRAQKYNTNKNDTGRYAPTYDIEEYESHSIFD